MARKKIGFGIVLLVIISLLVPINDPVQSLENPAPGTNEDSIANATKLVDAHRDILEDDEHTLRVRIGGIGENRKKLIYRSDNSDQQASLRVSGDYTERINVYINSSRWYKENEREYIRNIGGEPFERYGSNPLSKFGTYEFDDIAHLQNLITEYSYEAVNKTTENGHKFVRYKITGKNSGDENNDVNGYLKIREDGLIHELVINEDYRHIKLRYDTDTVDINRPDWTYAADRAFRNNVRGYTDDESSYDGDDDLIEWWD